MIYKQRKDAPMIKTGIYVDGENIQRSGGYGMRYDVLLRFANSGDSTVLRANSYHAEDTERLRNDQTYRETREGYYAAIRRSGFRLVRKAVKVFTDEEGNKRTKANQDMDLAIDALMQSRNLDRVILCTGDGDFVRLVVALQNSGLMVDVLSFQDVSKELISVADHYYIGYLIPGLVGKDLRPGYMRGSPLFYNDAKGYGKFQYFEFDEEGALITKDLFFHISQLMDRTDENHLTRIQSVFEFKMVPNERVSGEMMASDIRFYCSNDSTKGRGVAFAPGFNNTFRPAWPQAGGQYQDADSEKITVVPSGKTAGALSLGAQSWSDGADDRSEHTPTSPCDEDSKSGSIISFDDEG